MALARDLDDVKEFLTESQAYLDAIEPMLAALQTQEPDAAGDIAASVAAVFRAFHSIKGVAGFLSFGNVQELTHKAEETLDRVRTGRRVFDRGLGAALLESCDLLRKYLSAIVAAGEDSGFEAEKAAILARLKAYCEPLHAAHAAAVDAGAAPAGWLFPWLLTEEAYTKFSAGASRHVDDMAQCLIGLLDAPGRLSILTDTAMLADRLRMNASALGFAAAADLCGVFAEALRKPRAGATSFDASAMSVFFNACEALQSLLRKPEPAEDSLEQGKVSRKELETVLASQGAGGGGTAAVPASDASAAVPQNAPSQNGPTQNAGAKSEIRVSLERLDKMVDLIEELGVVSTGVVHSADASEDGSGLRKSAAKLQKITEELQEITVSIRMVPLSSVFRKMIRLVGDVSNKLGKKARLEMVGEQTELDKDAVESLQDPLVHILRNCVDHGLETPAERLAAGKPEAGLIRLQAWHSGGEAWISISDDGRGINAEKVLAKAVAQGLVPANAGLSDTDILNLIFHPGFSLAREVTEFSGRGVGMDVVKKNIQGLKGRVDLESKLGEGTTFLIRLPMANALTESMLVRAGSIKYVLRVASIQETFQPTASAVTRLPNGDEMVGLRGRLYPVVRLHLLHGIADAETRLERGLIILVENRGRQIGLFVDEVLGKIQAVIKQPPNLLKSAQTLAGCSIIGTDSDAVALALDINALDEKMAAAKAV